MENTLETVNLKSKKKLSFKTKFIILFGFISIVSQLMGSPFFYINWIFGGTIIIYFMIRSIANKKIKSIYLKTFFLASFWIIIMIFNGTSGSIIDIDIHLRYIIIWLFYLGVSVVMAGYLFNLRQNTRDSILLFLNQFWIIVSFISYFYYNFFPELYGSSTFSGIIENRNNYAVFTTILISYLFFFKDQYANKFKVNLLIFLSLFLILNTFSVKGFVGVALIYLLSTIYNSNISKNKRSIRTIAVVLISIIILVVLVSTDNPIIYRIERIIMVFTSPGDLRTGESAYLRSYFIRESMPVIKSNLISGIGLMNSKFYLIPPHLKKIGASIGTYSHNNFIEILLSGGVIAFIAYYVPFIVSIIKLWRKRQRSNLANYLIVLGLYKLFIDIGSVTYDSLVLNMVSVAVIFGGFSTFNKINSSTKINNNVV